jgi:plastocyanin
MKVEPERLKSVLGITSATFIPGRHQLAVIDSTLSGAPPAFDVASRDAMRARARNGRAQHTFGANAIAIDNFRFTPATLTVPVGTTVEWVNEDDVPHLIVSRTGAFKSSPLLDTGQRFGTTFSRAGTYDCFCSLHPMMQGRIVVSQ